MANEKYYSVTVSGVKNGQTAKLEKNLRSDMAGDVVFENVQTVGYAAAELLQMPASVSDPAGAIAFFNQDELHAITVSDDLAQAHIVTRVPPLAPVVIYPGTNTLYVKSVVAAAKLGYVVLDT